MWDAVVITVLVGKKVADFDAQILEQIEAEVGTEKAVKAERMQIGVRNEDGDIYRAFGLTGFSEFMDAVSKLAGLGLVDELQKENGPRHGYDAIFGPAGFD